MPNSVNGGLALPPEMLSVVERYAVYRCYSDSGQLLYVGTTGTMGRRLSDHLNKAWFTEVRGMTFEWYADELDALNAERRAIHVEHPKYNVVHRNTMTLTPAKRAPQKRQKAAASAQAGAPFPALAQIEAAIRRRPSLASATNQAVANAAGVSLSSVERWRRAQRRAS